MKTQTLIYSTIGIFALFTGAYIFISPIATKTLDAPIVTITDNNSQQSTSTEEIKKEEKQTMVQTKQAVQTQSIPQKTTEPKKTSSGYTTADVSIHNSVDSCWSIINGNVYDLTSYISRHPGGERNILRICGKDGSSAFEGQHGGESRPENILASYKIGSLN